MAKQGSNLEFKFTVDVENKTLLYAVVRKEKVIGAPKAIAIFGEADDAAMFDEFLSALTAPKVKRTYNKKAKDGTAPATESVASALEQAVAAVPANGAPEAAAAQA